MWSWCWTAACPASRSWFSLVRACSQERVFPLQCSSGVRHSTALVAFGTPDGPLPFAGFLPRDTREARGLPGRCCSGREADGGVRVRTAARSHVGCDQRPLAGAPPGCLPRTDQTARAGARGTAAEVASNLGDETRGEAVLVLAPVQDGGEGGSAGGGVSDAMDIRIEEWMQCMLQNGLSVKDVAGLVSDFAGLPGRVAYQAALEAKKRLSE